MRNSLRGPRSSVVAIRLAVSALVGVLMTAGTIATASASSLAAGKDAHFTIALSNSYIGNTWRIEMENEFKSACKMAPIKTAVNCSIYNANNNVPAQRSQMSDLIASGVNAIVTDAASPTGLNSVVQEACARGILVVSFDNTVTAPCALKVNEDQYQMGYLWAKWLAQKLHGHGNVLMVTGVSGTYVNEQRDAGAQAVWKKYPGIHVVDQLNGQWDSEVAQRVVSAALPSLPKIQGIWCQGGTNGVLKAFQQAGRPLPFTAGEAENGFRQLMASGKVQGYSIGQAPYLSVVALGLAYEILSKHLSAAHFKTYNLPLAPVAVQNSNNVKGKTWFPSLGGDFFADVAQTGTGSTVAGLCLASAKSGTACPSGKLVFSFH